MNATQLNTHTCVGLTRSPVGSAVCRGASDRGALALRETPSTFFKNPELLQHCERLPTFLCECEWQRTCFDCSSRSLSQNSYDEGGENAIGRSNGQIPVCVPASENIRFPTLLGNGLRRMESALLTVITMKGTGLLLCKPRRGSSHTGCLCALTGTSPGPNVYSVTAHSWPASAFEVLPRSANVPPANDDVKASKVGNWNVGMVINIAPVLNEAKRSLRAKTWIWISVD